jgi:NAD(P) transhydrogenase subunit alpha
MNANRKWLSVWLLLGSIVFAGVGLQLAADAWGKATPPAASPPSESLPAVRGQSPTTEAKPAAKEINIVTDHFTVLILLLAIFMLAIFVGFEVITKVPPTLHTPLMRGSNAISGITLVGAIVVAGKNADWIASSLIGMLAVALAMINVVGGFWVTHRMLAMFHAKKK